MNSSNIKVDSQWVKLWGESIIKLFVCSGEKDGEKKEKEKEKKKGRFIYFLIL